MIPYADPRMQHLAEWTAKMLDAAEPTAKLIGCSPAAIVCQAALESGWGAASIDNNVFGIKKQDGDEWTGPFQAVVTREWSEWRGYYTIVDRFRIYPTLADGLEDHFRFFVRNKRYANLFDPNDAMTDQQYLRLIALDGYATAPDYADTLIETYDTVKAFEKRMSTDGAPPAPPPPRIILIGSRGPDVSALQQALHQLGYYLGSIDDIFGPLTRAAVCRFQLDRGLEADGMVGPKTRTALDLGEGK